MHKKMWSDAGITAAYVPRSSGLANFYISAPTGLLLNGLARDDTVQGRTGDYATMTSIKLTCSILFPALVVDLTNVWWAIVLVRDARGTDYSNPGTVGGYLETEFGHLAPPYPLLKNAINFTPNVKFKTLKKGRIQVVSPSDATIERKEISTTWRGRIKTSYTRGQTVAASSIDSNAIYFYMWTDNPLVASPLQPYLECHVSFVG